LKFVDGLKPAVINGGGTANGRAALQTVGLHLALELEELVEEGVVADTSAVPQPDFEVVPPPFGSAEGADGFVHHREAGVLEAFAKLGWGHDRSFLYAPEAGLRTIIRNYLMKCLRSRSGQSAFNPHKHWLKRTKKF